MNNSKELENNKASSDAKKGKPSFFSYLFTGRKHKLYIGQDGETFYSLKRSTVANVAFILFYLLWIPVLLLSGVLFDSYSWNYMLDFCYLYIILGLLVAFLDYKLAKFEKADVASESYQKKIVKLKRNKIINKVGLLLVTVLFVFIFLNSLSFYAIRSIGDDSKNVYIRRFQMMDEIIEFDDTLPFDSVSVEPIPSYATFWIKVYAVNTFEPIELTINGKIYGAEDADGIRQENGLFWEDTYLWQRYKLNVSFGAETENVITLKCGDIEKEFVILVDHINKD